MFTEEYFQPRPPSKVVDSEETEGQGLGGRTLVEVVLDNNNKEKKVVHKILRLRKYYKYKNLDSYASALKKVYVFFKKKLGDKHIAETDFIIGQSGSGETVEIYQQFIEGIGGWELDLPLRVSLDDFTSSILENEEVLMSEMSELGIPIDMAEKTLLDLSFSANWILDKKGNFVLIDFH